MSRVRAEPASARTRPRTSPGASAIPEREALAIAMPALRFLAGLDGAALAERGVLRGGGVDVPLRPVRSAVRALAKLSRLTGV